MRGSGRDGRKRAGAAAGRRPTPRRRGRGAKRRSSAKLRRGKISRPRWIPAASGKNHVWRFFARRTRGRAARRRARGGIATARGTIFRIARRWRDGCVLVRVGTRAVRLVGARKRAAQTVRGAVTRQKAISFAGKNENAAGFAPRAPRRRGGRVDSATPKTRVRTCEVHHGEALLCAPRVTAEVHVLAEQLDRRRARQGHLGGCLGRAALQTLGDGDGILAICREDDLLRDGIDVRFVDIHSLGLVVADQRLDRRRGVHDRRRHVFGSPAPRAGSISVFFPTPRPSFGSRRVKHSRAVRDGARGGTHRVRGRDFSGRLVPFVARRKARS